MKNLFDNDPDKTLGVPDEEMDQRFAAIIGLIREEAKIKGLPIQEYDRGKGSPYLLYPDGRREYAHE